MSDLALASARRAAREAVRRLFVAWRGAEEAEGAFRRAEDLKREAVAAALEALDAEHLAHDALVALQAAEASAGGNGDLFEQVTIQRPGEGHPDQAAARELREAVAALGQLARDRRQFEEQLVAVRRALGELAERERQLREVQTRAYARLAPPRAHWSQLDEEARTTIARLRGTK